MDKVWIFFNFILFTFNCGPQFVGENCPHDISQISKLKFSNIWVLKLLSYFRVRFSFRLILHFVQNLSGIVLNMSRQRDRWKFVWNSLEMFTNQFKPSNSLLHSSIPALIHESANILTWLESSEPYSVSYSGLQSQSGAHRRGVFRDFQPNPSHL